MDSRSGLDRLRTAGTRPRRRGWRRFCVAVLLVACGARSALAAPPEDIASLVQPILQGEHFDLDLDEIAARSQELDADLRAWRRTRPDDVEGIVALAQITWLRDRLDPHVVDPAHPERSASTRNQEAGAALQRAAAQHPQVAALPYWQAQLLANPVLRQRGGRLTARPQDLPGAIAAALRACALKPDEPLYRDTAAALLLEDYRDEEAWQLLSTAADASSSALLRLLQDLRAVPLPPGAMLLQEDSRRWAEDQLARGRLSDATFLRARVYLLPGSTADFEAWCRHTWPDFRLLETRDAADTPAWRHHAMQMLLLGGGAPRPVSDLAQLQVSSMDGITLTLIEMQDPPQAQRQHSPAGVALPTDLGRSFVYLYIVNDRTLH